MAKTLFRRLAMKNNPVNTDLPLFCPREGCVCYQSYDNKITKDGIYKTTRPGSDQNAHPHDNHRIRIPGALQTIPNPSQHDQTHQAQNFRGT